MTANVSRMRRTEQRYGLPTRWLLVVIGVLWLVLDPRASQPMLVAAYALFTFVATAFFATRWATHTRPALPIWICHGVDALFVTALIALDGGLTSPFYLLYPLLALQSLVFAADAPALVWLPFLYGPLYAGALFRAHGSLAFLTERFFLTRYLLLFLLTVAIAAISWAMSRRLQEVDQLRAALDARSRDLASQTQALQQTATDLRDRVLELRSLQEVAKALSATLYLNDTLRAIANRLRLLTGSPYCAVALLDGERRSLSILVSPDDTVGPASWPVSLENNPALLDAFQTGRSRVLTTEGASPRTGGTQPWPVAEVEVTPMTIRGESIGALLVGFDNTVPVDRRPRSLIESFAYFAATSIENARLYSNVAEKGRELEAVLAGIGDGVVVADTQGQLRLMNPVAARIFALDAPLVGAPLAEILPSSELLDLMEKTATSGEVSIRELPIPTAGLSADGEVRTFQALAAPIYSDTETGDQIGDVVTVLRDITAQKELERMKSNFLSVVSHELKTPLHSIKGFVDIILMGKTGPVTELQQDFLSTVQEQTGHLQRLIEDLLEFSRLESGQIRLRPVKVYTTDLVDTVVGKLTPLADSKQLMLHQDMPLDFPAIEADSMRLEQVLTNLVENAIKFTAEGGQVRIQGWDRGESVELSVVDTGIGIPPEEHERIFDRFYQVDSSVRRRYKGTGLGLTICKHIVNRHGGNIWVENANGSGSEFRFTLPKVFTKESAAEAALDFGGLPRS
ncbi:MAG: ATP-binding protein [Chloroflexota bacterium]|nr:ATP-binding protein [Chloroflexota bacterium]